MELVKDVYMATQGFPKEEAYGLTSQIRRAAVSIPSNIAEGAARDGSKKFARFLGIAKGSLSELETQLLISAELGYFQKEHQLVWCFAINETFPPLQGEGQGGDGVTFGRHSPIPLPDAPSPLRLLSPLSPKGISFGAKGEEFRYYRAAV